MTLLLRSGPHGRAARAGCSAGDVADDLVQTARNDYWDRDPLVAEDPIRFSSFCDFAGAAEQHGVYVYMRGDGLHRRCRRRICSRCPDDDADGAGSTLRRRVAALLGWWFASARPPEYAVRFPFVHAVGIPLSAFVVHYERTERSKRRLVAYLLWLLSLVCIFCAFLQVISDFLLLLQK